MFKLIRTKRKTKFKFRVAISRFRYIKHDHARKMIYFQLDAKVKQMLPIQPNTPKITNSVFLNGYAPEHDINSKRKPSAISFSKVRSTTDALPS